MSHIPASYSENVLPNPQNAPPELANNESLPTTQTQTFACHQSALHPQPSGYPGPPPGPALPPILPPGAQPLPGMQPGHQPGYPPGYQLEYDVCYPQPQNNVPGPVVQQPGSLAPGGWMSVPQVIDNCPPGLEYLTMIDQILVHQELEILEIVTGFETNNKYTIKNSVSQKMYYAVEDNDCCTRNCLGSIRPFDMKILDNFGKEVIHLNRPLACDVCCFPCLLQSVEVSSPPGTIVGTVEQAWSLFKPRYVIKNAYGEPVLMIKGPYCTVACFDDIDFHVYSKDGEQKVGKITKQWSGLARELFTDADYFGISFPMDLDVKIKAVMLGACFLIDYMFFEKGNKECGAAAFL